MMNYSFLLIVGYNLSPLFFSWLFHHLLQTSLEFLPLILEPFTYWLSVYG